MHTEGRTAFGILRSSPLVAKLEGLRAQRDLLRQEVAALSSKDRELAEQHWARTQNSADASHHISFSQTPSMQSPGFGLRTPIAERIEAGLRALSEPSPTVSATPSEAASAAPWSIHRIQEPTASPAVTMPQLSIEEMKALVSSSFSQLSSRNSPHHTPASAALLGSVSRALPPMASAPQPNRSSPPRPKTSAGDTWHTHDSRAAIPRSMSLDRHAHRMLVLPPENSWTPSQVTPRSSLSTSHHTSPLSVHSPPSLHASAMRLAVQEQQLHVSKGQLVQQEKGLDESRRRLSSLERELTQSKADLLSRTTELEDLGAHFSKLEEELANCHTHMQRCTTEVAESTVRSNTTHAALLQRITALEEHNRRLEKEKASVALGSPRKHSSNPFATKEREREVKRESKDAIPKTPPRTKATKDSAGRTSQTNQLYSDLI